MAKHTPKSRMTERRRETREKRRPSPPQKRDLSPLRKEGLSPLSRGNIPQTAGFFQGFGSPVTENCTIAFNRSSSDDVPTVCIQQGIVRNSIFFGNFREGTASNDYANVTSNATFTNNLVDLTVAVDKGGWQGDPCFKNVARQDYRLSRASPAIDKGMFFPWMEGAVDLIGKPRLHRAPDLGCFEAFLEGLFFRLR